jgi:dTDP-4-dehydrorhamnose 3,5-epimerase
MIEGVIMKNLIAYSDDRGLFRELIRSTDIFAIEGVGQISHSLVYSGVIKAWHAHIFIKLNGIMFLTGCFM